MSIKCHKDLGSDTAIDVCGDDDEDEVWQWKLCWISLYSELRCEGPQHPVQHLQQPWTKSIVNIPSSSFIFVSVIIFSCSTHNTSMNKNVFCIRNAAQKWMTQLGTINDWNLKRLNINEVIKKTRNIVKYILCCIVTD